MHVQAKDPEHGVKHGIADGRYRKPTDGVDTT